MLPTFFIAHGSPTLAIESNAYVEFLHRLGQEWKKPRAILLFSAHWEEPVQAVGRVATYDTIHDFYGFPDEMYQLDYPAQGDSALAERVHALLTAEGISARYEDRRGLDHGAWVVLRLLVPQADIPVLSLSVNPSLPYEKQYRIGQALAQLREEDMLIIGSGGTVHNLRQLNFRSPEAVDEWAVAFDEWLADRLQKWDLDALFRFEEQAPHARQAVPRNEHFIPLLYAMGAADADRQAKLLYRSYQYGSLSLSCWQFG